MICYLAGQKEDMPFAGSEEKAQSKHSEEKVGLLSKIKNALFG